MSSIILRLPAVKTSPTTRPRACPYCGSELLHGWGRYRKRVRDQFIAEVETRRYRCLKCEDTFRHYPEGVSRADQTARLKKVAATLWAMGLSYRQVEAVLAAFGTPLGRSTVCRDVHALGEAVRQKRRRGRVKVLGVDGAWLRAMGEKQGVVVAVDLGTGEPIALEVLEEQDTEAVRAWLEDLVATLGVEVIVTDDLSSYRQMATDLEVEHQICKFHMRRWVGRSLRSLRTKLDEEWEKILDEVEEIVADMTANGDRRLFALWHQIPARAPRPGQQASPLYQLKQIMIRLSEHWGRYYLYGSRADVPTTNNGTERAIGKLKVRSRSVRGYKTPTGIKAAFQLCGGTLS
jgi:transposase-like protein